jgi:iron complex outermembrane receptor protein
MAGILVLGFANTLQAQEQATVTLTVTEGGGPLPAVTVELLSARDSALVKVGLSDAKGRAPFVGVRPGRYIFRATHSGYLRAHTAVFNVATAEPVDLPPLVLQPTGTLANVTVTARRPFVEQKPGKTLVNLESSITAVGSTVAEALERLPGVTIDKDGNIALKGRTGVRVYIDGKPTNLSGAELATMLQGMSASNIAQIELMDQPPARYEAAGGAGIINLITKKTRQKGFNGSISTAYTQGRYARTNNSLQLAFRSGKWSLANSYSFNANRSYLEVAALRRYYDAAGNEKAKLDQPSLTNTKGSTHSMRGSADYNASAKTTFGITWNGLLLDRGSNINNEANWYSPQGVRDSALLTLGRTSTDWRNGGLGVNMRHSFSASRQISIDVDQQWYRIHATQYFENSALMPSAYTDAYHSEGPGDLRILTARTDYNTRTGNWNFETGARFADTRTDNEVIYQSNEGSGWHEDLGRSNHFVYHEQISAGYGSAELKAGKWSMQGGLRFEATRFDARQLGNAMVKDSSFARSYNSLFPTMLLSFDADSSHSWSFSAGRRIDRPAFQKLNPFTYIINKYTVQRGNPFFRPQYSWSFELAHTYKGWLLTSLGYSITTDYFAQMFPVDPNGLVVYTEGNLGKLRVLNFTLGVQQNPAKWWSLNANVLLQHKWQEGFVERAYTAQVTQGTLNLTNNFRFNKGWSAELSGFYVSRSQNDIQELVDPAGQLSIGLAKTVMHGAGTLKLSGRDLFHTQWMKGNTDFKGVTEWFKLTRDTRAVAISFSWRFGKAFKQVKRNNSVNEEVQRAGNG